MLRGLIAVASLVFAFSAAASGAPADHQIEARGKPKASHSDLIVKVKHVPSGKYVAGASVWYFTTTQGQKGAIDFEASAAGQQGRLPRSSQAPGAVRRPVRALHAERARRSRADPCACR
jgi:hypothetical protein